MTIQKNRIKVYATGGLTTAPFTLGSPLDSFTSFSNGSARYIAISSTNKWQIGLGVVTGSTLTRGVVEENYLGTLADIDFTGETIQIANIHSAKAIIDSQAKLDLIEDSATADQTGAEIKVSYEAEANTNAFTDLLLTKLNGIEDNAKNDQVASDVPYTPIANNSASNVQTAIDNVSNSIISHTQPATQVVYDPALDTNTSAVTVQDALEDHSGFLIGNAYGQIASSTDSVDLQVSNVPKKITGYTTSTSSTGATSNFSLGEITINSSGAYDVYVELRSVVASTATSYTISLYKNGSSLGTLSHTKPNTGTEYTDLFSGIVTGLSATDVMSLWIVNTSGTALACVPNILKFKMVKVGN